jgi:hypothetical protein
VADEFSSVARHGHPWSVAVSILPFSASISQSSYIDGTRLPTDGRANLRMNTF